MLSLLFLLGLLLEGKAWALGVVLPVVVRRFIDQHCPNFSTSEARRSAFKVLLLWTIGGVFLTTDWFVTSRVLTYENILTAAEFVLPPLLGLFLGIGSWLVGLVVALVLRELVDSKYPSLTSSEIGRAALTTVLLAPTGCLFLWISWLIIKVLLPAYGAQIATGFSVVIFAVLFVVCCSLVFLSNYNETRKARKHNRANS